MSDVVKKQWKLAIQWTIAVFALGGIYTQIHTNQASFELRLTKQETALTTANKERSDVLILLGRLEERIKAIQEQLNRQGNR